MNAYEQEWNHYQRQLKVGNLKFTKLFYAYLQWYQKETNLSEKSLMKYKGPLGFLYFQRDLKQKSSKEIESFYNFMGENYNLVEELLNLFCDLVKAKDKEQEIAIWKKYPFIDKIDYFASEKRYQVKSSLGTYTFWDAHIRFHKEIEEIKEMDETDGGPFYEKGNLEYKCHLATKFFFLLFPFYENYYANTMYCRKELKEYYWTHSFISDDKDRFVLDLIHEFCMEKSSYMQLVNPVFLASYPGKELEKLIQEISFQNDPMPFLDPTDLMHRMLLRQKVKEE